LNKPKENICDKEIILGQFNQAHYLEAYKNFVGSILGNNELTKIKNIIIEPE